METDNFRLSFEYFPPKTEKGLNNLANVTQTLNALNPAFFSVTYGAGGSTRDNTKGIVKNMLDQGIAAAPHLSFGGDDEESMLTLLNEYKEMGVKRIVALRGDMPSGVGGALQLVYANELVSFIRQHFDDYFHLEVACYPEIHPEATNYDEDIRFLKQKLDAGAHSAISQYFYNPDAFVYFMEECDKAGIKQPIYPGIMPITNFKNLARFSANCGAEIPRWIAKRLEQYGDDTASISAFGVDLVTNLCEILIDNGAPGLHFYTMNQAEPIATIVKQLGLDNQ